MVDWLETKLLGFRYSTLLCRAVRRAVRCDRSSCHCGVNLWRRSAAGVFFGMKGGNWEQIGNLLFYLFDFGISLCKILQRCDLLELSLL
jgi:hypothetical protein